MVHHTVDQPELTRTLLQATGIAGTYTETSVTNIANNNTPPQDRGMQQHNPTLRVANQTTNRYIATILPPIEVVTEATLNPVQADSDPTATITLNATPWPEETQMRNRDTKSRVKVLVSICKTRGLLASARQKENSIA